MLSRLKQLLHYNPETGVFTSIVSRPGVRVGQEVGTVYANRRRIMIDRRLYKAHRLAWLYVYGEWPKGDIDHIDGNPLNNAISNLRDVTRAVNMQNIKKARADSTTGLIGVQIGRRGRYVATICTNGKRKHLGTFLTAEEASAAYVSAKRVQHVEGNTL